MSFLMLNIEVDTKLIQITEVAKNLRQLFMLYFTQ